MVTRRTRFAVLPFMFSLVAVSLTAQSLPRRTEADKLLQETVHRQNLQAVGNPPFHLLAHVRYVYLGTTKEGVYELLWAAPDHFRETVQFGKVAETDFASGDKIYITRSTSTLAPHIRRLQYLVRHPLYPFPTDPYRLDTATVSRVYSDPKAGTPSFCLEPGDLRDSRVCFDAATREVILLHSRWGPDGFLTTLDESDFISIDNIRYPRRYVRRTKDEIIEVSIEKLEKATDFAADVFVPPANSEVRDWCLQPVLKPGSDFPTSPFPKTNPPNAFFPFYVLTKPDGRIEKFVSLNSSAPPIDSTVDKWIRKAQYPIWMCGNKAIQTELIIMSR